jgi:hypothetical protein
MKVGLKRTVAILQTMRMLRVKAKKKEGPMNTFYHVRVSWWIRQTVMKSSLTFN